MATENSGPSAKAIQLGHEPTDVNVKGLFLFAGALLATLGVILLGMAFAYKGFRHFDNRLAARQAAQEPGARSLVNAPPAYNGPLLQLEPEQELKALQTQTAQDLHTYGWVDRQTGVVRLPIDRAMDLLVARGIPPISPGLTLEALQRQRAQPQVFGQPLRP